MIYATTNTETYSVLDVETVFRSFKTELRMIADSSCAFTREKAEKYGHDAEYLAKMGYLKLVDLTLLDGDGEEVRAAQYTVNTAAGELTSNRPGGVLWPKTPTGSVSIHLFYTAAWHALAEDARARITSSLKINWIPSNADTSHSTLKSSAGRSFVSNTYGMERQDYTK